jgi:branched-chain amino acid transport system substrate-binding protein
MDQDISEKSPYVMRYYIGINEEAKAINNYFKENMQNTSRVGVIYAKVPSIEKVVKDNYVPFLESMNKIVPLQESYKIGESDFKTTVLKIRKSNIDHLIILGYGFEYPNIFNELNHSNILRDIKILGGWGFLYTQVNPNLLEGVMVSGPDYVFKNQKLAGKFYQKYFNTYDSYPNFDAAFAYNVVTSIAENLKKEDFSSPIKEKFISNNNLDGVVGKYNFSKEGNMIVSTGLGVYKNGTIVFVEK